MVNKNKNKTEDLCAQRKKSMEHLQQSVRIGPVPKHFKKCGDKRNDDEPQKTKYTMRWVRSEKMIKNAVTNQNAVPVITSSGRTFTC